MLDNLLRRTFTAWHDEMLRVRADVLQTELTSAHEEGQDALGEQVSVLLHRQANARRTLVLQAYRSQQNELLIATFAAWRVATVKAQLVRVGEERRRELDSSISRLGSLDQRVAELAAENAAFELRTAQLQVGTRGQPASSPAHIPCHTGHTSYYSSYTLQYLTRHTPTPRRLN